MILAVMQPYFFPYIGYFQLARGVDHFVFLDDAAFIKKGFVSRNRILLNGQPFTFSVPVRRISQNRCINEHYFSGNFSTFLKQLRHAYSKAPFFESVFALVESVCLSSEQNVAQKNAASVSAVFNYLQLPFSCSMASSLPCSYVGGQARILDICRYFSAETYHNAAGGRELYNGKVFLDHGVRLRFLTNFFSSYNQCGNGAFVPGLSIIDVLMNNHPEHVQVMLQNYDIVETI